MVVVRGREAVALDDGTPATADGLEPPERASWKPPQSHRQRVQVRRRRQEDVLVRPPNGLQALLVQVVVSAVATAGDGGKLWPHLISAARRRRRRPYVTRSMSVQGDKAEAATVEKREAERGAAAAGTGRQRDGRERLVDEGEGHDGVRLGAATTPAQRQNGPPAGGEPVHAALRKDAGRVGDAEPVDGETGRLRSARRRPPVPPCLGLGVGPDDDVVDLAPGGEADGVVEAHHLVPVCARVVPEAEADVAKDEPVPCDAAVYPLHRRAVRKRGCLTRRRVADVVNPRGVTLYEAEAAARAREPPRVEMMLLQQEAPPSRPSMMIEVAVDEAAGGQHGGPGSG